MTLLAALLAAAAATAPAPAPPPSRGVEVERAEVRATIVKAAAVRQAGGFEQEAGAPAPQITRRGREILVEFQ